MRRRVTVVAAAAALLAGCMLGPDYKRPSIAAPPAFQYEPKDAADTADTLWWKQFNDPVLDGLIAEALAHNGNIAVAVANVEHASTLLTQTHSQIFQHVGYGASAECQRTVESDLPPLHPNYTNPSVHHHAPPSLG